MVALLEEVDARRRLPRPALARAIREDAGVSQGRLAAELNVSRVTLGRWESGQRRPRGEHLVRYVQLLDQLREVNQ